MSGYAGGPTKNPTYREVCSGATGHAEVIQIRYDAKIVSYEQLLLTFFQAHDPTTLNQQGADKGTQYRSVILYHDEEQMRQANEVIGKVQDDFRDMITTEVSPIGDTWYRAEEKHQEFFKKNPGSRYC